MVDGYPAQAGDPDLSSQELINRTLEHGRAMAPLQLGDTSFLLTPALKRLDWNLRQNPGSEWIRALGPMINRILRPMKSAAEADLILLCEWVGVLKQNNCHDAGEKIAQFAWKLFKSEGLSQNALNQLRKAQRTLEGPGTRANALFQLGWTILRAEPEPVSETWSASVRRDIEAKPKKLRGAWLNLLDANDHAFDVPASLPKPAAKLLASFDRQELETSLATWARNLAEADPLRTGAACLTLLNYLLRLCHAQPEAPIDESLHRIACAKWPVIEMRHWPGTWPYTLCWLPTYLMAVSGRPPERAFACVEALMMNPATKSSADVERLYQSLLATAASASVPRLETAEGVDRFRIEPSHPRASEHLAIDQFLRAAQPSGLIHHGGIPTHGIDKLGPVRDSLVNQAGAKLPATIMALSERAVWLAAHGSEFDPNTTLFWRVETGKLMYALLAKAANSKSGVPLDTVISAARADTLQYFGYRPSGPVFELCRRHIENRGWNKDLLDAMKTWVKSLHGTNSDLDLRRKAGWFLWFEDVSPIKANECWSNVIRGGLRSMPAEERRLWMPLVTNASFAVSDKPSAKWMNPAKEAFQKLGVDKFRPRYREWFEPFRQSEPLKLTMPGRDMLRLMIWYALVAEDPQVDEAVAWFSQAQWKTKDAADRAAKADTAFCHVMTLRNPAMAREAFERMLQSGRAVEGYKIHQAYLKLSQEAGTAPVAARPAVHKSPDIAALQAKQSGMMQQMLAQQLGTDCAWFGNTLEVKTPDDTYRIDSVTARITRGSDGKVVRVEIPYDAIPYKFFRAQIDEHDLQNPGQPNLMRTMMCALILRRSGGDPGVVVPDSTGD